MKTENPRVGAERGPVRFRPWAPFRPIFNEIADGWSEDSESENPAVMIELIAL